MKTMGQEKSFLEVITMSTIRERFKLSTLSLAIISSCSMQAFAFEEEAPKAKEKEKEQIEVIEVSGYRGSIQIMLLIQFLQKISVNLPIKTSLMLYQELPVFQFKAIMVKVLQLRYVVLTQIKTLLR